MASHPVEGIVLGLREGVLRRMGGL
jgi:hypothetical protein